MRRLSRLGVRGGRVCGTDCVWCGERGLVLGETQGWFVQCLLRIALPFRVWSAVDRGKLV